MDSLPYTVELKDERWRNVENLIKSRTKFSLMGDNPVILQKNMFYTVRHQLRFELSESEEISKITSEAAETVDISYIGQVKHSFKGSLVVWNGDPFAFNKYHI